MEGDEKQVSWEFRALSELTDIHDFIAENYSETSTDKLIEKIFSVVAQLQSQPARYPPCRQSALKLAGMRCINIEKRYIIIYKVEEIIRILAVVNAKRNLENLDELTL